MFHQMNRSWVHARLFSREFINGVKEFMNFVHGKFGEDEQILCPCSRCLNQIYLHQVLVERHILMNGMEATYTRWIHHGENCNAYVGEHHVDVHDPADSWIHGAGVTEDDSYGSLHGLGVTEDDNYDDGHLNGLLQDLHTAEKEGEQDGENQDRTGDNESFYKIVIEEAKRQLYPGCTKYSRLSFVVKLLHMKSLYKIPNSAFSAILKLLADAKSLLKELGLGYESIHVCYNNCVLFSKKYANLDNCPVCGQSRWADAERKKIPMKVLRHFPLVPRLQRMFVNKEAAQEAQWHKLKRDSSEKEMSHPADGEAWQDFDRVYPDFAEDARNLRLGLATDGFNPFSEKNTK
jgi:hypothetical protein